MKAVAAPYLALGDSIAAGTQQPVPFTDNGYTGRLFKDLKDEYGFDTFVNLACPGDDTREMLDGNYGSFCYGDSAFLPPGGSSQLAAALAYLAANPGEVKLITLTMGANDILGCNFATPAGIPCFFGALDQIGANLTVILAALQAAAPGVPIIAMNYYNSSLGFWPVDPVFALSTQALVPLFNGTIEAVYAALGVPVADVENAFDTFDTSGKIPKNFRSICKYTRMCEKHHGTYMLSDYDPDTVGPQIDIHPTNKGYKQIAKTFSNLIEDLGLFDGDDSDSDD
ncbi:MAG: SGNH/GDSL hydrolase family protein [Planctomycetes bacterium]|nr:SGNH/GDSL hydrolase family protein [Planctomycetota bacterium]